MRSNLNAKISDKLKARFNFTGARKEFHNTTDTDFSGMTITDVLATTPSAPLDFTGVDEANLRPNTVSKLKNLDSNNTENTVLANLGFDWDFAKNLTFSISGGISNTDEVMEILSPASGIQAPNTQRVVRGNQNSLFLQNINKLAYNNSFGDHDLDIAVFLEQRSRSVEFTSIASTNFTTLAGGSTNLSVAGSSTPSAGVIEERSLISYFSRANYSYADKYFATASIRIDQTSVFPNNRTGVFSGFGLGWEMTKEKFMEPQKTFSGLKLRLGWGQTGNQNMRPLQNPREI